MWNYRVGSTCAVSLLLSHPYSHQHSICRGLTSRWTIQAERQRPARSSLRFPTPGTTYNFLANSSVRSPLTLYICIIKLYIDRIIVSQKYVVTRWKPVKCAANKMWPVSQPEHYLILLYKSLRIRYPETTSYIMSCSISRVSNHVPVSSLLDFYHATSFPCMRRSRTHTWVL